MKACAELAVAGPARAGGGSAITRLIHAAPIAFRPTPHAVYMVSSCASPVGDDDVTVLVEVGAGASLTVRSTAATLAWSGQATRHEVRSTVAANGTLDWAPEPLLTTGGCRHRQSSRVSLHPSARVLWREVLVLGRHAERSGTAVCHLSADVCGRPLLRHTLTVGGPGWDGPAVLAGAKAVATLLIAGDLPRPAAGAGPGWAVLDLDGPGAVVMAAGASHSEALGRLAAWGSPCTSLVP